MPYGEGRAGQAAPLPSERAFTGQLLDTSTGLTFYGSRFYDSSLGRFVQPDTIVPEPGNPQDLNRYTYVRNSPITFNDPTGHFIPGPTGDFASGLTCLFCELHVDISNWPALGKGLAVVGCAFTGCHADLGKNVITGPTAQEWIDYSIVSLGTPLGMVEKPLAKAASSLVKPQSVLSGLERFGKVGKEVLPDILKAFGDQGHALGKIPDAFEGRQARTIGRWWDTNVGEELGDPIFKVPEGVGWSAEANFAWLQEGIKNGDLFYLSSPVDEKHLLPELPKYHIAVYARELDALLQAGYRRVGDYLIPPH